MSGPAAKAEDPYPKPALGWYVIGTLFIAWVFAYLDRQIITLMVPMLKVSLDLTDTQISLIQGLGFSLFFAIAGLPIGRLVDRHNRRNIIIIGVVLWSLMTVLSGLATTFWQLFAARVAVGIGEACLAPASFSIAADYFHPSRRGRAMGVIGAGTAVGNAASLILGGLVLKWLAASNITSLPLIGPVEPYQVAFMVIGAPGLLLALLLFTVPEPARREVVAKAAPGSVLGYLWRSRWLYTPVYLAFVLNYLAGFANALWGPVVFMRIHKMAPGDVGIMAGMVALVCGLFSAPISGWLSDMLVKRRPLDGRFLLPAVCLPIAALGALPFFYATSWIPLLVAFIASNFWTNFIGTTAYATLQDLVPNERRGQIVAVYLFCASFFGFALAPTLVALITDYGLRDPNLLHISIGLVTAPAFLFGGISAWWGLAHYRRAREEMLRTVSDS